jgi:hypothetical protein
VISSGCVLSSCINPGLSFIANDGNVCMFSGATLSDVWVSGSKLFAASKGEEDKCREARRGDVEELVPVCGRGGE